MALYGSDSRRLEEETTKPRPGREGGKLVLLLLAFFLALGAVLVPSFRGRLLSLFPQSTDTALHSAVVVWTKKQAGTYYCRDSKLYGRGQGAYMEQGKALTSGYQPALGEYCPQGQTEDSSGLSPTPAQGKRLAGLGVE